MIIVDKISGGYYAGFDSNKGAPVFNKTPESAVELNEIDAEIVARQLTLLGFQVEAK